MLKLQKGLAFPAVVGRSNSSANSLRRKRDADRCHDVPALLILTLPWFTGVVED
jgi:hypothetical protein